MLDNAVEVKSLTAPTTITADTGSTAIDTSAYEGNLLLVLSVASGGTGTLSVTVQDSADNTAFSTVPSDALFDPNTGDDAMFGNVTSSASFQVLALKKTRCQRYVRLYYDAGTSHNVAAVAVVMKKYANFI